jgi:F-type H+-transporting ATPase subunit delta
MSARTIARRYANALFDVARKAGRTSEIEQDLRSFRDLVADNADLARVLDAPSVPPIKKRGLVDALVTRVGMTAEAGRLLVMLAERDRLALLGDVVDAYIQRGMELRRVMTAEVTTAEPMGESQRAAIAAALTKASGAEVTITEKVDPNIVGGIVARMGSVVFDASVVTQIERMRQKLIERT